MENKKKLSKKTWIIIIASVVLAALLGTMVGVIVHHNKQTTITSSEDDNQNYEPATGLDMVNMEGIEGPDGFQVKKEGNQLVLYGEGQRSNFTGVAPVTISKYDKRRQLYVFVDGVFQPSYVGTIDTQNYGTFVAEQNGMVDVYNPEDRMITTTDHHMYYCKYGQIQKHFTGAVQGDSTGDDDLIKEYDVVNGLVIGWTDVNGYYQLEN